MTAEDETRLVKAAAALAECDRTIAVAKAEYDAAMARLEEARTWRETAEATHLQISDAEVIKAQYAVRDARETMRRLRMRRDFLLGQRNEIAQTAAARAPAPTGFPPAIADAAGFDLRPDPLGVASPADLVTRLRRYRIWAGEPSFRAMARRGRPLVAASTMCTALSGDELPPLRVVLAIVTGCGGTEEDQRRFATAWRTLRLSQEDSAAPGQLQKQRVLRAVADTA